MLKVGTRGRAQIQKGIVNVRAARESRRGSRTHAQERAGRHTNGRQNGRAGRPRWRLSLKRPVVTQRSSEEAEKGISRAGCHTNRRRNGRTSRPRCRRFLRRPRATQGFAGEAEIGVPLAGGAGDWRHGKPRHLSVREAQLVGTTDESTSAQRQPGRFVAQRLLRTTFDALL